MPSTPFTSAQCLDKTIADECLKSTKSSNNTLSRIQALFLDKVGPFTAILEGINQYKELSIKDVEGTVKAALTFLHNASSKCTSLRRIGILHDYNKDLVSYGTESDELFSSATTTLLGPLFPEKAAAHLNHLIVYLAQRGVVEPQAAQLSLPVAMRLTHFHTNWNVITIDQWVLDTVNGFQIPFTSQPDQRNWPNPPTSSKEQSPLIQEEV